MAEAEKKFDHAAHAKRTVEEGNVPTVPSTLYFTYTRTDGDSFIGPASHAEGYLRKGYTISGEETIDDFVTWMAEQSAKATPKAAEHEHESGHEGRAAARAS